MEFATQAVVSSITHGIKKVMPSKQEFNDIKAQHWVVLPIVGIEGVTFPTIGNTILPAWNLTGELFLGKHFYFYTKIGAYFTLPDHRLYNSIDYMAGISTIIGFGGLYIMIEVG